MNLALWLLGDSSSSTPGFEFGDWKFWAQLGSAGFAAAVVTGLFVRGMIVSQDSYNDMTASKDEQIKTIQTEKNEQIANLREDKARILQERDKAQLQLTETANMLQTKLIPVVEEFVITSRAFMPMFQELGQIVPELRKAMAAMRREQREKP